MSLVPDIQNRVFKDLEEFLDDRSLFQITSLTVAETYFSTIKRSRIRESIWKLFLFSTFLNSKIFKKSAFIPVASPNKNQHRNDTLIRLLQKIIQTIHLTEDHYHWVTLPSGPVLRFFPSPAIPKGLPETMNTVATSWLLLIMFLFLGQTTTVAWGAAARR